MPRQPYATNPIGVPREHYKTNRTNSSSHLNASSPPECPRDRQYEDILLQDLSPVYEESIRRAYLEWRDVGFADIGLSMLTKVLPGDHLGRLYRLCIYTIETHEPRILTVWSLEEKLPQPLQIPSQGGQFSNELKDDSKRSFGSKRRMA